MLHLPTKSHVNDCSSPTLSFVLVPLLDIPAGKVTPNKSDERSNSLFVGGMKQQNKVAGGLEI